MPRKKKDQDQNQDQRCLPFSGERRIVAFRLCFIVSMLIAAAVFGGLAYKVTHDQEENTAVQTYQSIAMSALKESAAIVRRKQQGADSLVSAWSYAFSSASQWPFVGLRGYTQLATRVALLSGSVGHGFMTIVRPDQVSDFEAHAKQLYEDFEYPETAGWSEFGFGIYGVGTTERYTDNRFHDTSGNPTWNNKYDILVPFLQHKNTNSNPSLLMKNMHQFELRGKLFESVIDCGRAADTNLTVLPKCGAVTDFTEIFVRPGPSAVFFNPIFPADDPTIVVGFIGTSINWAETLTNIAPDYVDGLHCIISNGVESYTYVIQKGIPILLGEGDRHDPAFDRYKKTTTLSDSETGTTMSVAYTLSLYPTEVMFDEFRTHIPMIASIGFVSVIFVCTCLFFLYDYFMKYESLQRKKILDVKRRFVRFISHEIRTPLNVVCMGLDLLQTELIDTRDKAKLREFTPASMQNSGKISEQITDDNGNGTVDTNYWLDLTQEIHENSHNAVTVLNDLLNYDKVESGTFELDISRVDIWTSMEKTVKEFDIQARNRKIDLQLIIKTVNEENADIEADAPAGPLSDIYLIGDDRRMAQVIRNLVSNALKFTPENEVVTVTVSYISEGLPEAAGVKANDTNSKEADPDLYRLLASSTRAGSLRVVVEDNGVGLSQNQLGLLFNEGVQFDPNILQHGGGSGLGLCITKEIVELHGGTIEALSGGLGSGTTFAVEIPLFRCTRRDAAPTITDLASNTSHNNQHCVLVVDDVITNSKMLVRLLERAGHHCSVAVNGKEAVEAYAANLAEVESGEAEVLFDTILMDFEMPIMNGPEATKQLRELGCNACIFGVTGNVLSEDVALFKASGVDTVLYKPINFSAIDSAWENSIESSRRQ